MHARADDKSFIPFPRRPAAGFLSSARGLRTACFAAVAALMIAGGLARPAAAATATPCPDAGGVPCATVAEPTLKNAKEAVAEATKSVKAQPFKLEASANPEAKAPKKNQIRWYFKNRYGKKIEYKLYAANRNWAWPGGNKVFVLPANNQKYTTLIDCKKGEKVCFGAWVANNRNIFWGVGYNARYNCNSCCYICKGVTTPTIVFAR